MRRHLQAGNSPGRAFLRVESIDILPWLFPLDSSWWIDAETAGSSPVSLVVQGNTTSSIALFTQRVVVAEADQIISAAFTMAPLPTVSLSPAALDARFTWGDGSLFGTASGWPLAGEDFRFGRGFPLLLDVDLSSGDASLVFDVRLDAARTSDEGYVRETPYAPPSPPRVPGRCLNTCTLTINGYLYYNWYASRAGNGRCEDGGAGSDYLPRPCDLGTDVRFSIEPMRPSGCVLQCIPTVGCRMCSVVHRLRRAGVCPFCPATVNSEITAITNSNSSPLTMVPWGVHQHLHDDSS